MPLDGWTTRTVGSLIDEHFSGAWGEEPRGSANALVLRATNLVDERLDYTTAAPRNVPDRIKAKKGLRDGDLLLEASGGSPDQPVGRVARFDTAEAEHGDYVSSNFFRTLRVDRHVVLPEYAELLLQRLAEGPGIRPLQRQTTGIINLDFKRFLQTEVSLPEDLRDQRRIVEALQAARSARDLVRRRAEEAKLLLAGLRSGLLHVSTGGEVPISDVCVVNPPTPLAPDSVATFVPMAAVSEDGILMTSLTAERSTSRASGYTTFASGDVLLAKITPCFENGKAARFQHMRDFGIGSTEFHVLRTESTTLSDLVFHVVHSAEFRHRVEASMTGSAGQRRVSAASVREFRFSRAAFVKAAETVKTLNAAMNMVRLLTEKSAVHRLLYVGLREELLSGRDRL